MCAKSGVPLPPSLMPLLSQKKDDKANQKSSRDTLKELTEVREKSSIKPGNEYSGVGDLWEVVTECCCHLGAAFCSESQDC